MSKLNDSTEKYFFNYLKEHNNFLTDQEYHSIAHKAAQIPDTFIDYEKRDEIHVFKLLVFFGIHPSKARLNITQTQQVIKEQNLHPKKLAINNFHDFANVKKN